MLCGLVGVSSGFLFLKRMKAEEWVNFNRWIFGIYAAGNVTTKAADAWRENGAQNPLALFANEHQDPNSPPGYPGYHPGWGQPQPYYGGPPPGWQPRPSFQEQLQERLINNAELSPTDAQNLLVMNALAQNQS